MNMKKKTLNAFISVLLIICLNCSILTVRGDVCDSEPYYSTFDYCIESEITSLKSPVPYGVIDQVTIVYDEMIGNLYYYEIILHFNATDYVSDCGASNITIKSGGVNLYSNSFHRTGLSAKSGSIYVGSFSVSAPLTSATATTTSLYLTYYSYGLDYITNLYNTSAYIN